MGYERVEIRPGVECWRGDALEVMRLLPPESVDFIFTDPSYGHNNNKDDLFARREVALSRGKPGKPRPILNDSPAHSQATYLAALTEFKRLLRCCCWCCCCCAGGGGPDPQFARWSLWMDAILSFKHLVIWDKGKIGMGWEYRRSTEMVLVAVRNKGKARWYDRSHKVENIIRPGDYGIRRIVPRADQHPTEKCWQLSAHFMRLHSRKGDVVLDPFMGSGSTGEAAMRLGRRFIGIELDRKWFRKAVKRIEVSLNSPLSLRGP
ncbi:MAG: site-specific DNA-methyltransferase [Phycisphaerae bacterium]